MPAPDQIAFGKLPKKSDARTLSLPALLTGEITPEVEVDNQTCVAPPWGELGNNTLQDCAIAAAGHAEMLWAAKHGKPRPKPTLEQIVDAYTAALNEALTLVRSWPARDDPG
jgi:hypothetical protein